MKTILRYLMPEEAEIARLALDDEGIASYIEGATTVGMFWHLENAVGGAKLLVAEVDAERATEILATKLPQTATDGLEPPICPECGAKLPPGFCVCWSCSATLSDDDASDASPQTSAAPGVANAPIADQEDDTEPATAVGDAMAWRAFAAAVIGLVFLPGILHIYSIWTLLKLGFQNHPLSKKGTRNFVGALCVDLVACILIGWLIRRLM